MRVVELAKAKRAEFDALKAKSDDADVLVSALEKVKNELPASAKTALVKHLKKKAGKKP